MSVTTDRPGAGPARSLSWLVRLFEYKPFLVFVCMLPTIGLLMVS